MRSHEETTILPPWDEASLILCNEILENYFLIIH